MQAILDRLVKNRAQTPAWIAVIGALLGIGVALLHPYFNDNPFESVLSILDDVVEYFVYAIGFFALFWIVLDKFIIGRKLTKKRWPKRSQVFSEALFSMATQFVFLGVGVWQFTLMFPGVTRENMYRDISEYGIPYYLLTILIAFILHDAYFYWAHRMMHQPTLYKLFHKTHHESRDPTPFTTFHFHPVEAALEGAASFSISLMFLVMPWHASVPAVWLTGMIIFNSIGHLGYEIYPSWWHKIPIFSTKTTGMHHYMHHQRVRGNYGLYFRFWDRLCGTEFKDYEQRYDDMFDKIKAGKKAKRDERMSPPPIPAANT
ncbi:MAG: sterol desaturase family protein [Pseudomonadota bacterium]